MTTPTLSNILIGQWVASPRLTGIVAIIQRIMDDAVDAADRIQLMQDIDEAEGVWLDYIGVRLGIRRPSVSDPSMDDRFGFNDAGVGFNQDPFRGAAVNDAVYPLPDSIYRRLVKARAVTVLGDGSIETFGKAVRAVDANARVHDYRNMSVLIVTSQRSFMELADSIGALPRTAGVMVRYGLNVAASTTFAAVAGTTVEVNKR